jgi:hypothetical protein
VSENDSNETTYQSQFGIEVERREAHLAALPGSVYREWFESLNRASKVFSGNSSELEKHLTKFVGTPTFVSELSDDFGDESARLLHNYLAALATLRDTQRSIHHKLSPEPDDNDPNRTRWEVTVWDPKRKQLYGDDPIAFLVKLRDYSLHYTIPVVTMATSFESTGGPGGPMQFNNTVAVHRPELLKWNRWTTEAKRYIDTHDGDNIELLPLVALYSTRVREFFGWFWKQVEDHSGAEYREYLAKYREYWHWRTVEDTWVHFGPDGTRVQFRKVAEARRERAKFGTSGWRVITLDEYGEWVVGGREAEWPPLPKGPR